MKAKAMYSDKVMDQIVAYCDCCHDNADCLGDCPYKAECDEIRNTYGCKPCELSVERR